MQTKASSDSRPCAEAIRCLVVDDSALVRLSMKGLLERHDGIIVDVANDPLEAEQRMARVAPDVMLLDVEMPHKDGITWLAELRRSSRLPVVMFSSITPRGSRNAVKALSLGASEVVCKPTSGLQAFLSETGDHVCDLLINLGRDYRRSSAGAVDEDAASRRTASPTTPASGGIARRRVPVGAAARRPAAPAARETGIVPGDAGVASTRVSRQQKLQQQTGRMPLLLLGASTGGLPALEAVLLNLTADCAPVLIAQHMPEAFMEPFRERMDNVVVPTVRLAVDGEPLCWGHVYIAPGDRHLGVQSGSRELFAAVSAGERVNRHRPSVDHLFDSAARLSHWPMVAGILTGMGDDGARGMVNLHHAGALTLAQALDTCVVAGMPGSALQLGGVDEELPLASIGATMAQLGRDVLG